MKIIDKSLQSWTKNIIDGNSYIILYILDNTISTGYSACDNNKTLIYPCLKGWLW